MPQLTENEVKVLIEAMRIRGELGFKTEEAFREACDHMSREELVELLVMYWQKGQKKH